MTSDIDWNKCRKLYERGLSPSKLAKRFPEVSRQAIDQMAQRHDWIKPEQSIVAYDLQFPGLIDSVKYTDARAKLILDALRNGASKLVASGLAKISHQTIANWMEKDTAFAAAVIQAQAQHVNDMKGHIVAAAPDDWKAADRLLQTHELTRAEHGNAGQGQSQVNVVININRPPIEQPGDSAKVIDHE